MTYRATIVRTPEEQLEWLRLRESVYVESGILGGSRTGIVHEDEYDARSVHFLVRDEAGLAVACSRLILGSMGSLQVEDQFGVVTEPGSGEFSGFAVLPGHRGGRATYLAIGAVLAESRRRRIADLYAEVEGWLFESLRSDGYPLTQISEPRFVYNADNFVFHAPVDDSWSVLQSAQRCSA